MGVQYEAVLWNKQKKYYNLVLLGAIFLLMGTFVAWQLLLAPNITIETLIIRTTALTAIVLLHFILIIGPLSRINTKFLPLLYNRRHLGVTMFLITSIHVVFSTIQFHALSDTNPILSLFTSNQHYAEISRFPFQTLGFFAFLILFVMAATSHDFWLKQLGPKTWKVLHMLVYLAYALVLAHIMLGILQDEAKLVYWLMLAGGFLLVSGLHLYAGLKENRRMKVEIELSENGFYKVGPISDIAENRAKVLYVEGQNIAIFKYNGLLSAVSNICRHQHGPLGEGKIVDGCITCPWHGYQYQPANGQAPPPFKEKLETYQLQLVDDIIWVNPSPNPEGTYVEPIKINTQ